MKKIALSLLALAYATRLFGQAADPSPTDQGKTGTQPVQKSMRYRFWERLQLTDDQKEKLKQIREADRDSLRSVWVQVKYITADAYVLAKLACRKVEL